MFAYCLNNPVNYVDASGTASKSCLHDFTEPESPWKDSGSGGGRPYRNYSSSSNYYGEVADKFYSVRFFRAASNGLKTGAKWLWDAYMRGYNIQVEAQYKNSIALREGVAYFVEHPKKAEVLLRDMVGSSTAIATATSIAIAGGPVSAFAGALFFACVALWDVSWSIGEIVKDFQ